MFPNMKKTVAEMIGEFTRQLALVVFAIMPLGDWVFHAGPIPWPRIAIGAACATGVLIIGVAIERNRQEEIE